MKKLKKFVLNDARLLSREELASIEGSLDLHAVEDCTNHPPGTACVFAKYYDPFTGHYTFVIGRCSSETVQIGTGNNFVTNYYCV